MLNLYKSGIGNLNDRTHFRLAELALPHPRNQSSDTNPLGTRVKDGG